MDSDGDAGILMSAFVKFCCFVMCYSMWEISVRLHNFQTPSERAALVGVML